MPVRHKPNPTTDEMSLSEGPTIPGNKAKPRKVNLQLHYHTSVSQISQKRKRENYSIPFKQLLKGFGIQLGQNSLHQFRIIQVLCWEIQRLLYYSSHPCLKRGADRIFLKTKEENGKTSSATLQDLFQLTNSLPQQFSFLLFQKMKQWHML